MCVCRHTPVLLKLNRLSNEYTITAFMKETQFYHHSNVLMCHWETAITHGSLGTKIVAQQTCFQCSHAQHVSNTAAVCEIGNFWQNISIFWVMQNTSHFDARLTCLSSCALYSFTFELWENKRVECVPQPLLLTLAAAGAVSGHAWLGNDISITLALQQLQWWGL